MRIRYLYVFDFVNRNSTMQARSRPPNGPQTVLECLAVAAWARTHTHPGSWVMVTPEGHPAHPATGMRMASGHAVACPWEVQGAPQIALHETMLLSVRPVLAALPHPSP